MRKHTYPRFRDIAVIGMSCRFPGANNVVELWTNLRDGVESISFFSPKDLLASGVERSVIDNPNYVRAGSVITDIDKFDASFFGLNAREAESMDPQERIFMQCAWHALEDAAYDPAKYPGSIGVYAGCAMSTYLYELYRNPEFVSLVGQLQILIGNDKDYLTTHTSYKLNLRGPSINVQTTCSTSLVAVCLACEGLMSRQCDMALAGGICIRVPQQVGYYYEPGGIFSPDGHCRVFDSSAQGVVFGNGVGIVVLKRLDDALEDGDAIYAVIRGTAVNNDGAPKASYAAPGMNGQAEVIALAHARARVKPDSIGYIEAHGTGTTVGDPIEIAALTKVFGANGKRRKARCAVGSVKSNVGHLDHAAGIAGFIKAVLSLQHKQIPPSLHFKTPNPEIDFANSPFYVNHQLTEWKSGKSPRRAGVSAFGIGGTNAHVVLQEAPPRESAHGSRPHHLLLLSAKSTPALESVTCAMAEHLSRNFDIPAADLAYTSQVGRAAFSHRRVIPYRDVSDLLSRLQDRLASTRDVAVAQAGAARSIAFMFSGQGAQYVNMGRDLYEVEGVFREHVDCCSEMLKPQLGMDLRTVLFPTQQRAQKAEEALKQTALTQPALFTIEYSLAKLWMHWGVRPSLMIGHSVGEYVAACLAGVFSLQDGLTLIAERGRLMQSMPPGSMVAVALPERDVLALLGDDLSVAALNEPSSCVVSGPTDRIEQLEARLIVTNIGHRRLHTSHAFHSPMMEPVVDRFADLVTTVELPAPQIPYVSNVSGQQITPVETTDPRYWAKQLRLPVRFVQGLEILLEDPERVLLEVGPGHNLAVFARRHPAKKASQLAVSSLRHPQEVQADTEFLLNTLGQLWASGAEIDWASYHADKKRLRLHLPIYPFEQKRYWVDAPNSGAANSVRKKHDIAEWFYTPSWKYTVAPECRLGLEPQNEKSRWLIFEDECGLSSVFSEHLVQLGCDITTVKPGQRFLKLRPQHYEINPWQLEDYLALFKDLEAARNLPENIGHLWSVTPHDQHPSFDDFDHRQTLGLHSVLLIAQALIKENIQNAIQIAIISNHIHNVTGDEKVCPNKIPVLAACKAIPQEYPNLGCRNLDIVFPAGEQQEREKVAEQLAAELMSGSLDPVVAYRGGQRWVQVCGAMRLEAAPEISPMLREGGVYLITGGMGNIGMVLAEELAASVQAKLALVGRSAFPKRSQWTEWLLAHGEDDPTSQKILRLQGFESLGAEIMVFSADLADEEKMREVIAEIQEHLGPLNGLIHGAGNLAEDSFFAIDQASPELCERQFHSKIRGLVTLETVLSGSNLDFWVMLSSVSSVLGGLGYVAYSAANIFLDASAYMKSQSSGVPWISINWDTWDFRQPGDENGTALAMFPEEGVEAFRRILSLAPIPQVVVSTGELDARIDQWVNLKSLRERAKPNSRESTALHSRPELGNPYMAPRNEIEQAIADIWQETLGVAQVGVLDNYFTDLSGSSLLATQLVARLRNKFHVEFPLRRFLEAPTVADLALAIERIHRGAAPEAKTA